MSMSLLNEPLKDAKNVSFAFYPCKYYKIYGGSVYIADRSATTRQDIVSNDIYATLQHIYLDLCLPSNFHEKRYCTFIV